MKVSNIVAGAVVAVAMTAIGIFGISPARAYAASCDKVNIVHCGIDGSSASGYISAFKALYNKGTDNGHDDLQAVYNWAGLSDSDVAGMNTDNTKLGTLYRNGEVKVNGEVVANDARVSARFTEGDGFTKIKDGVWARKTTTSFANDSVKVLVHYKGDTVDSVVMVDCGNAVKVTPVVKPKPVLKCVALKGAANSAVRSYTFTATASATNTKIESYTFNFGDDKTATVASTATTASTTHTFADYAKTYKVTVAVNGTDQKNVTASTCAVTITTPPAPAQPTLVCDSLKATQVAGKQLSYTFSAAATPTKTTITNYVFDYGDGVKATVATAATTATSTHTYTENGKAYTATVTVNSVDVKNQTSASCKVTFTTPKVEECKPGIPVGSEKCKDTPVVVETPKELVNAGPGAVAGIFAGTSALGALGHRIIRRRISRD